MTTALQIIDRAYALLGYKAAGEALSADDAQYGLDALNSMIDSWNTQGYFIVSVNEVTATVSGQSATVGTGLNFDTVRPTNINSGAFTRINGVDYPLYEINREQYERITVKTITSTFPQYFYYDGNTDTARVWFFPVPISPVEIHLPCDVYLTQFADTGTQYSLVPGYKKALEYSLAEELAPGIKPLDPMIARTAANARRAIRRTNVNIPELNANIPNPRLNFYIGL
jgi:hypothetical protein